MAAPGQNAKKVLVLNQASTTNGATASGNIDTLGYDYVNLDVIMTTSNDATNNPSVLKLSESDDTVVTNFADITEFVGDGTGGFTIPSAITAATSIDGPYATFNVNCRGRKRYLKLSVSPVTTQSITAIAQLGRAHEEPVGTTDQSVSVIVNG